MEYCLTVKKVKVKSLSHVRLFATPWTAACQAPPSMGFSRQEYWSGLPFCSPGFNSESSNSISIKSMWINIINRVEQNKVSEEYTQYNTICINLKPCKQYYALFMGAYICSTSVKECIDMLSSKFRILLTLRRRPGRTRSAIRLW